MSDTEGKLRWIAASEVGTERVSSTDYGKNHSKVNLCKSVANFVIASNFRIRNARLTDATELAELMCELGYQTTSAEMRMRLQSILSDRRYSTFVATIDNELCAMIGTLTHVSHEHNDLSGKIIALVVSKKKRRSGIGRGLIAAAEKISPGEMLPA